MYPLFSKIDLLITDYSSIYFDFLLTNKPVLFYAYDKEKYITKHRSMYDNYDDVTPGFKVYNYEQLHSKIRQFFTKPLTLKDSEIDYEKVKNLYNKYSDSNSAIRTFDFIKSNL